MIRKKNGKHLILDLDETLVHTFSDSDKFPEFITELTEDQKKRVYVLKFPNGEILAGYIRPGVEKFLEVAFKEFESVSMWSAGTQFYVQSVVDIVFKDTEKPKFVMTRKDCNEIKLKYDNSTCRYKPLEIIYDKRPEYTESNTLIIDDRHDICALNCMNNIRVPEFLLTSNNYEALLQDKTLFILAAWFETPEFRDAKEVRVIKSKSPFAI